MIAHFNFSLAQGEGTLTPNDRVFISGNMSEDLFVEFIQEGLNNSDMILLHNSNHSCSLRMKKDEKDGSRYYFYDSNNTDGEKSFDSLKELYESVVSKLSTAISIEYIAFNGRPFDSLRTKYKRKLSLEMILNGGFHVIAQHSPKSLNDFINMVKTDEQQEGVVVEALNEVNTHGWSGWAIVAQCSPESLNDFITWLKQMSKKVLLKH